MEAFTHEQQVLALVLANTLPESFENPHAQRALAAWVAQRGQSRDDFPKDTNVSLFDAQGALIASSAPAGGGGLAVDRGQVFSGGMVSKIVQGRLYTAVPVTHEGRLLLGMVEIDSSLDSVNARLFSRWLALIGATGAVLALACVAAFWLAARLTRPLSKLRGVAQQMSEGRLGARVEMGDAVNEMASLGAMFNHMAEQIEVMMQEQRDFVANASHELRAPLSAIKIRSEALAERSVAGDRARQYAAEINDDVGQMGRLVNDLLQLSRAESGAFVPPEQPICVADELFACVRAVRPRLAQRHQQFNVQLAEDIPDVYIHSNDLSLMVANLLDNAIKYTPEGGSISLAASWRANLLEIAISDNGEGIPPEDLPRISERFFRVDRAHTRSVPGVGLGLALVAAVVRQYNGMLRIASSGIPGQGTQAYLGLPVAAKFG
jgi:signal transduction histidine kinase